MAALPLHVPFRIWTKNERTKFVTAEHKVGTLPAAERSGAGGRGAKRGGVGGSCSLFARARAAWVQTARIKHKKTLWQHPRSGPHNAACGAIMSLMFIYKAAPLSLGRKRSCQGVTAETQSRDTGP